MLNFKVPFKPVADEILKYFFPVILRKKKRSEFSHEKTESCYFGKIKQYILERSLCYFETLKLNTQISNAYV